MKGVQAHEIGGPEVLRYGELPELHPGPGEALVNIKAKGSTTPTFPAARAPTLRPACRGRPEGRRPAWSRR